MSEHDQQVAVIDYCEANGIPVFAIPNGGLRSKRTAATFKTENVKPGMSDLFILLPRTESAIRRRWNRGWELNCNNILYSAIHPNEKQRADSLKTENPADPAR